MAKVSVTTDYCSSKDDPIPYLHEISQAGFTHIHWCHQWITNYLYSDSEIEQIGNVLGEVGLKLQDLHTSCTDQRCLWSTDESIRLAGMEIISNRISMTGRLGGDAIIVHPPVGINVDEWDCMDKSMQELEVVSKKFGVRVAFENLFTYESIEAIMRLLEMYPEDYVGVCYDSGHGNLDSVEAAGIDFLDSVKDRLLVLHLNDNDGTGDQHMVPFDGTVDWDRLCAVIESSVYSKAVSMEINMNARYGTTGDFLRKALAAGEKLSDMCSLD